LTNTHASHPAGSLHVLWPPPSPPGPARSRLRATRGALHNLPLWPLRCPLHFAAKTLDASRKAGSTAPNGSRHRSRYSRAEPTHPARTTARTSAPTEGLCARTMAILRVCEAELGTGERRERAGMGGLGGAFEACGSCAPSRVAEEVGGHGRPTGESNPAASGRPEAGYRSRATSVRHPLAVTAAPAGRLARRDTQSTGRPQQSGGNQ
jgi:hypothetical protein